MSSISNLTQNAINYTEARAAFMASPEFNTWLEQKAQFKELLQAANWMELESFAREAGLSEKVFKKIGKFSEKAPVKEISSSDREAIQALAKSLNESYAKMDLLRVRVGGREIGYFDEATRFKTQFKKPFSKETKAFAKAIIGAPDREAHLASKKAEIGAHLAFFTASDTAKTLSKFENGVRNYWAKA